MARGLEQRDRGRAVEAWIIAFREMKIAAWKTSGVFIHECPGHAQTYLLFFATGLMNPGMRSPLAPQAINFANRLSRVASCFALVTQCFTVR